MTPLCIRTMIFYWRGTKQKYITVVIINRVNEKWKYYNYYYVNDYELIMLTNLVILYVIDKVRLAALFGEHC